MVRREVVVIVVDLAYPLERPLFLSVTMRTLESSPNCSNSVLSHSSSTCQDRFPTNKLLVWSPSALDFLAEAAGSSTSALRFLETGAEGSSFPLSESEDEDEDEESEDSSLSGSSSEETCQLVSSIHHTSIFYEVYLIRRNFFQLALQRLGIDGTLNSFLVALTLFAGIFT